MPVVLCGERGKITHPCAKPEVSYEGCVLERFERNGYDDSDFIAVVWDEASGTIDTVEYASTRGWTYHNGATVDATPEVIAKARAWLTEQWTELLTEKAEQEARQPRKGVRVRSLTTRGKNVGVEGEVKWYGTDGYRSTRWNTYHRVGVEVDGEEKLRYLPADRVEVIDPEPVDPEEIRERAEWSARQGAYRSIFDARLRHITTS